MTLDDRTTSDRVEPEATMSLRQAAELVHELIQNGQGARAEDICRKALTSVPDDPLFMHSLAVALAMQGRISDALPFLRKVVKVSPDNIEALQNLGRMLFLTKHCGEAVETFKRLLHIKPDSPKALCDMGNALWQLGKKDEAEDSCRKALEIVPDMREALFALGTFAYAKMEFDKTISLLKRAEKLWPGNADVQVVMALTLMAQDRLDDAVAVWRRVVELRPDSALDYANLGNALLERAKRSRSPDQPCCDDNYFATINDAVDAFHRSLDLNSHLAAGHRGLGDIAWLKSRSEEEFEHYSRVLAIEPEHVESRFTRAVTLLRMGNYAQGWEEYECRWKRPGIERQRSNCPQPLWDGRDLGGRKIMLHGEQGHGDVIQFARYVPMVADRGGHVILQCAPELERLFRPIRGVREIACCEKGLPDFDVYYPLMSLPLIFKTTLESIPSQIPYLHADAADVAVWRRRLGEKKSFRVGFAWCGNPTHRHDRYRSCSLRLLAPLPAVPGTSFFSLQMGARPDDLAQLTDMGIADLSPQFTDYAQTAAAMAQLDLVISVDTSVVHLAGAMGLPVWPLLAFESEWRWLENRSDSLWYPTARLFRQDRPGNWQGLIQGVAQALQAEVERQSVALA